MKKKTDPLDAIPNIRNHSLFSNLIYNLCLKIQYKQQPLMERRTKKRRERNRLFICLNSTLLVRIWIQFSVMRVLRVAQKSI